MNTLKGVTEEEVETRIKSFESVIKSDLLWVLSDVRGRRYIHHLIENECGLFQSNFIPGSQDATAHNLGKQEVGLRLFHEINAIDGAWEKMSREAKEFQAKKLRGLEGAQENER